MVERLKLFPRYLINMGLLKGFLVFLQVELFGFPKTYLPGYKHPIYLRPNTSDRKVFREIFLFQIYSFAMRQTPKTILDGGANIGLASVFFANQFKEATILAVEPEGTNLEVLKKNTSPYSQIKIAEAALWNSNAFLRIKNLQERKWAFSVEECSAEEPGSIQGLSVPNLMGMLGWEIIDLLKLDIESSEKELFEKDSDAWIKKTRTMVVELHDWMKPGCSASFFAALGNRPFSLKVHEGMLVLTNNELE